MTDLATLGIAIESKDVARAQAELDRFVRSSEAAEQAAEGVEAAGASMGRGARRGAREAAVSMDAMVSSTESVARSTRDAAGSTREWSAAVSRQARDFEDLRASVDPIFASAKRYEAAVEQANAAVRAGVVTQDQANRVLDLAANRYLAAGGAARASVSGMMAAQAAADGIVSTGMSPSRQMAMRNFAFQLNQIGQQGAVTGDYLGALSIQIPDMLTSFGFLGIMIGGVTAVLSPMIFEWAKANIAFSASGDALGVLAPLAEQAAQSLKGVGNVLGSAASTLVDNLDRIIITAGVAATFFGGRFVASFAAARLATMSVAGAMTFLRGAIIRTGFGALIVGAGELVYQFVRLVEGAGGFGNAMELLGRVWTEVTENMSAVGYAMEGYLIAAARTIAAAFLDAFAAIASGFSKLSKFLLASPIMEFALGENPLVGAVDGAADALRGLADAQRAAAAERASAASITLGNAVPSLGALRDALAAADEASIGGAGAAKKFNEELGDLSGSSGGAAKAEKAIEKAKTEAEGFAAAMREAALTAEDLGREKAGAIVAGIDGVSKAFGDFVARGFRDFQGFVEGVWKSFQGLISQMIALAAKRRIMIGLGLTGGGAGGAAVAGVPGGGALGGGLMGGLGKAFSGFVGSWGAGGAMGTGLLGGLQASVSGGLGGIFSIGANSAAAGGGLAATVGAALPVIGIAAAAFSLFVSKTKLLDAGIRVTVDQLDVLVESFRKVEKSRLFGLIKSKSTSYDAAEAGIADPVEAAVRDIQGGVLKAAKALGVGASAFDGFATQVQVSTKDMSDEEALRAVQEALGGIANDMAAMALAGQGVIKEGESAAAALERLASSLVTANDAARLLGQRLFDVSIAGADAASGIVEALGGLDGFRSAVQSYFQGFYTAEQQLAATTAEVARAFAQIGQRMPATRREFRQMVEAADTTTAAGRKLYAELLGLAGALDEVLPPLMDVSQALSGLIGGAQTQIDAQIAVSQQLVRDSEALARDWERAADSLNGFLSDLRSSDLGGGNQRQILEAGAMRYRDAVEAARAGAAEAAADLPAIARGYLEAVRSQAGSLVEYQRSSAAVQADISSLASVAEAEGDRSQIIAALAEEQVGLLTEIKDYLAAGVIDETTLALYSEQLDGLQGAIKAAQGLSTEAIRAFLAGGLQVGPTAELAQWYGAATRENVAQPMGALRQALDALRGQVAREAAAREADRQRRERLSRLQAQLSEVARQRQAVVGQASSVVGKIRDLEQSTGVDIRNGAADATIDVTPDGFIRYLASGVSYGSGSNLDAFRKAFWAAGGLEDQLNALRGQPAELMQRMLGLRQQIAAAGGVPAFADGGNHRGGLARVGETDMELVAPSRIYSPRETRKMLDNAEVVAELRALRREVADLREENRQLGLRADKQRKDTARTLRGWDVAGMPAVRP